MTNRSEGEKWRRLLIGRMWLRSANMDAVAGKTLPRGTLGELCDECSQTNWVSHDRGRNVIRMPLFKSSHVSRTFRQKSSDFLQNFRLSTIF